MQLLGLTCHIRVSVALWASLIALHATRLILVCGLWSAQCSEHFFKLSRCRVVGTLRVSVYLCVAICVDIGPKARVPEVRQFISSVGGRHAGSSCPTMGDMDDARSVASDASCSGPAAPEGGHRTPSGRLVIRVKICKGCRFTSGLSARSHYQHWRSLSLSCSSSASRSLFRSLSCSFSVSRCLALSLFLWLFLCLCLSVSVCRLLTRSISLSLSWCLPSREAQPMPICTCCADLLSAAQHLRPASSLSLSPHGLKREWCI
jgi:hypothetical protein